MELRALTPYNIILESVFMFIYNLKMINNQFKDKQMNMAKIWMIAIDIKEHYSSTDNEYAFKSLHTIGKILDIDPSLVFMIKNAMLLNNKFACFETDDDIFLQNRGQKNGGDGSGDICDCTLFLHELMRCDNLIKNIFILCNRYKDDIFALIQSEHKPNINYIESILYKIYGKQYKFEIKISQKEMIFLSVVCSLNKDKHCITTTTFIKLGNSYNYTRK